MKKITKHLKKAVLLTAFAVFTGGTISSITMLGSVEEAQAATGNDVVTFARTLIGRPYVFGSTGPNSFDCSGLVQYVFKQYGTYFPNDSIGIYNNPTKYGTVVGYGNLSNAKPGDVISWNGHIAIYSGNGNMVHAETAPSKAVAERKVSALSDGKNRNGVVYRASDYKVIRVNGITDYYAVIAPGLTPRQTRSFLSWIHLFAFQIHYDSCFFSEQYLRIFVCPVSIQIVL